MRRLVYSPKVNVYVKVDRGQDGHDIVDLSPYVVSASVNRKLNQVSSASVTFRNPKDPNTGRFLFTEREFTAVDGNKTIEPMFHPMDPIVITMTRLVNRPVQVFTGYCDTTPYFQMRPGVATIEASCTLKRLLYTYWDPALPFVQEFLMSRGFNVTPGTTMHNFAAESQTLAEEGNFTDSGLGSLLFAVLEEVGGWDKDTILIEPLPKDMVKVISGLFEHITKESKEAQDEFLEMLGKILTTGSSSSDTTTPDDEGEDGGSGGTGSVSDTEGYKDAELTWYNPNLGGINGRPGGGAAGVPLFAWSWGCAAPPEFEFGTIIRFAYKGKYVDVPVLDRGGAIQGNRFDLLLEPAKELGIVSAGRVSGKYKIIGKKKVGRPGADGKRPARSE